MPFTPKDWIDLPSHATPVDGASLEDMETRLAAYTDEQAPGISVAAPGGTDDTAIVQAGIDAAAGGGTVRLAEGTYVVTALDVLDGVTIIGEGRGKTIIKAKAATTGTSTGSLIRFRYAVGSSDPNNESHMWGAGLCDLTVDGNGRSPTVHGVELRFVDRFRFDSVVIRHFNGAGIFIERGLRESVSTDVYVRHCGNVTYAAVHIIDGDSTAGTDGSNEVYWYGLRVVFSRGHSLRIEKDVTYTNPTRLLYFIGCMFHGAINPVEPDEDGYSYTVGYEDYQGHCALIHDAREIHFVGCSFHRSGRGKALVRTGQGNNGASSVNKVYLTNCYFGTTNYVSTAFTASSSTGLLLTFSSPQYLSTGAVVRFANSGGTLPTGITTGTDYWLIRVNDTTARVATSASNASAGTAIAYTNAGTGTHTVATRDLAIDNGWGQTKLSQYNAASTQDGLTRLVNRTGASADLQETQYDAPTTGLSLPARISALETLTAAQQEDIVDLDERVTNNSVDLASLEDRVAQLENISVGGGPIQNLKFGTMVHQDGNITTLTPPLPTGLEEGDKMIAIIHSRQTGRTITWPAGWTQFYFYNSTGVGGTGGQTLGLAWKDYESTDTAPAVILDTVAGHTLIGQVFSAQNIDANPLASNSTPVSLATGSFEVDADGIETIFDGSLVMVFGQVRNDTAVEPTVTTDDGLTWARGGYTATTDGGDATLFWDYVVADFDQRPIISDKVYSTGATDTQGSRGHIIEIAASPRPSVPAVLKEDLAATADPTTNLWYGVTDGFAGVPTGAWSVADTQVTWESTSPDSSHVPVNAGASCTHYRRLKVFGLQLSGSQDLASLPGGVLTLDGSTAAWPTSGTVIVNGTQKVTYTGRTGSTLTGCSASTGTYGTGTWVELQSTYDASAGNLSVRTMLVRDSVSTPITFYRFEPGMKRTLYMSTRCTPTEMILNDQSMVWQFKQKPDAKMPPILGLREVPGGFALRQNVSRNPIDIATFDSGDGCNKDEWIRWGFEVYFDADPAVGYVRVFADFNQSGTLSDKTGKIYTQTCYAEGNSDGVGTVACLSVGPYHSALDAPALYRDYSGIQVVDNG